MFVVYYVYMYIVPQKIKYLYTKDLVNFIILQIRIYKFKFYFTYGVNSVNFHKLFSLAIYTQLELLYSTSFVCMKQYSDIKIKGNSWSFNNFVSLFLHCILFFRNTTGSKPSTEKFCHLYAL